MYVSLFFCTYHTKQIHISFRRTDLKNHEVSKHKNKTVLRCGREVFINAHHIEEKDSLLFTFAPVLRLWSLILIIVKKLFFVPASKLLVMLNKEVWIMLIF
jgi:hypothetical protein